MDLFEQLSEVQEGGYSLCQELVNQSFINQNSLLMREKDYSGLGFFKQYRDEIFGEWSFINSDYRPLEAWAYYDDNIQCWQVEKYCECLLASSEAYFRTEMFHLSPRALYTGLERLAAIAGLLIRNIKLIDKTNLYASNNYEALHSIQNGLEKIVRMIIEHQDKLPEYELVEEDYKGYRDETVYGAVANGIYEYFEQLATARQDDDAYRNCGISVWLAVFGTTASELATAQNEIGKRLILHLNKKVDKNFDVEFPLYPIISRLLLSFNGIYENKAPESENLGDIFHRSFIQRLKDEFPLLALKQSDYANEMLPEGFEYDQDNNELKHHRFRGRVTTLKFNDLEAPNEE